MSLREDQAPPRAAPRPRWRPALRRGAYPSIRVTRTALEAVAILSTVPWTDASLRELCICAAFYAATFLTFRLDA